MLGAPQSKKCDPPAQPFDSCPFPVAKKFAIIGGRTVRHTWATVTIPAQVPGSFSHPQQKRPSPMSMIEIPRPDEKVLQNRRQIVADLKSLVPVAKIIADDAGKRTFETDALTAYKQLPLLVILPTTTEEVSTILAYCNDNNIKIVGRGAGTSLCGGALPAADSIIVGVSRMNRVLDMDYVNRAATVQAGITNLAISGAAAEKKFFYAPDPSSQLACSIAGNIAMNSGGAHCLKYGVTTNNLLGVTMVMMDGSIVDIGGKYLDSPGYDLLGLICGSEGQLGIITEATVKLIRSCENARPMLIGFSSIKSAGECVAGIIEAGMLPAAIEFMDKPAIKVCENYANAGYPLDVEALLLVEFEGSDEEIDEQFERLRNIARSYNPKNFREAQTAEESALIWKGRKSAFGAMGQISDYYCMDGVIPLSKLAEVLEKVFEVCNSYGLRVSNIFHAGDGNLHPLILYNANDPDELLKAEECGADLLKLCVDAGGCLTGEHGVGIEKRDLMRYQFTQSDLDQQMRIKSIFDPKWLLNPAKVFPLDSRPVPIDDIDREPKTGEPDIVEAAANI